MKVLRILNNLEGVNVERQNQEDQEQRVEASYRQDWEEDTDHSESKLARQHHRYPPRNVKGKTVKRRLSPQYCHGPRLILG